MKYSLSGKLIFWFVVLLLVSGQVLPDVSHRQDFSGYDAKDRPWYPLLKKNSPPLEIPRFHQSTIAGNIPVYSLPENKSLLRSIFIRLDGGMTEENHNGLTRFWADVWLENGKRLLPAIGEHGTSWEVSVDDDHVMIRIYGLADYFFEDTLAILEYLLLPRWDEKILVAEKNKYEQEIKDLKENPAGLAFQYARRIVWKNHPVRGRRIPSSLAFSLTDLEKRHKEMVARNRVSVFSSFPLEEKKFKDVLEKTLAKLSANSPIARKLSNVSPENFPGKTPVYHYVMDIPTSVILYAGPGVSHGDHQYYAYKLANHIVGGDSFNSVIAKKIRVEKGWAYAAYSYYESGKYDGTTYFFIQASGEYAAGVLGEMGKIQKSGDYMTPEKLEHARSSVSNKFVFLYSTLHELLQQKIAIYNDGLPEEYLETFIPQIQSVTLEQWKNAKENYFSGKNMPVILVGPQSIKTAIGTEYNYRIIKWEDLVE